MLAGNGCGGCGSPTAERSSVDSAPVTTPSGVVDAEAESDGFVHPTLETFSSGSLVLHGWLWRPLPNETPRRPPPVIVYNHGSESMPGPRPDIASFFVHRGFVLFVPHRRGQGRSHDVGPFIQDIDDDAKLAMLDAQTDDVLAAIAYVRSLPDVDPKAVALAGCSFGGIETLYAAARTNDVVAALDFAGGAMSWKNSELLRTRMHDAAVHAKMPVFFLQAENDFDTRPSKELSAAMTDAGKPEQTKIYPANGITPEEGHAFCHGGASPPWGDDVLAFLAANGVTTKPR